MGKLAGEEVLGEIESLESLASSDVEGERGVDGVVVE